MPQQCPAAGYAYANRCFYSPETFAATAPNIISYSSPKSFVKISVDSSLCVLCASVVRLKSNFHNSDRIAILFAEISQKEEADALDLEIKIELGKVGFT